MNTWTTVNCHPYVGVHTILDIWISVSQISKILGWLSWLSQFGDGKMKHFPAGIPDVGWVLIHYVLISKGSQLWSGMAINSFLGGVKQKPLCSGFSADRAALEKLKYGLWTRMWRPALSHVWGLKVWIQTCSQSLDSHKDHTNLNRWATVNNGLEPVAIPYTIKQPLQIRPWGIRAFSHHVFCPAMWKFSHNSWVGFFCFFMQVPFMGWVFSQFIDAGSDLKLGFSLFVIVGSIHVWLQTPKHCQKWMC